MEKNEPVPTKSVPKRRHRSHSRSERPPKKPSAFATFLRRYWGELLGIAILLLGIFLLIEKFQIRTFVFGILVWLAQEIGAVLSTLARWGGGLAISDVIGLLLVIGAVILIVHRIRARLISRHVELGAHDKCPRCGKSMDRVPSKLGHRILSFLMHVRIKRYSCHKCPGRATIWEHKLATQKWG